MMARLSLEYRGKMIYGSTLRELVDRAVRDAIEDAARIADHHPHLPGADPNCLDAQGCCEMIAGQIRDLAKT
jgi:hypothetical protein